MEFTFGPRHRTVIRSARFPWVRVALTVATGMALGLMLLAALGILTPAHAGTLDGLTTRQMQDFAASANDRCRDNPNASDACSLRDGLLRALKAKNICWNAKAPTPETLWQPCAVKPQLLTVDGELARCASVATKADQITQLRDRMTPRRYAIEWGYPAPLVDAIYSGKISSYRGADYCYSLENIEATRRAVGAS